MPLKTSSAFKDALLAYLKDYRSITNTWRDRNVSCRRAQHLFSNIQPSLQVLRYSYKYFCIHGDNMLTDPDPQGLKSLLLWLHHAVHVQFSNVLQWIYVGFAGRRPFVRWSLSHDLRHVHLIYDVHGWHDGCVVFTMVLYLIVFLISPLLYLSASAWANSLAAVVRRLGMYNRDQGVW